MEKEPVYLSNDDWADVTGVLTTAGIFTKNKQLRKNIIKINSDIMNQLRVELGMERT